MHSTAHDSSDTNEMIERLLSEMRQYRGERGIYAAEMLKAARFLLEQPELHPRQAETAAYCIRQAVKEVFGDTRDRNLLPELVKRAVKAKNSIQTADAAGEADLQNMYRVVTDLEDFVCNPKPEVRLKELFRQSSGIEPMDGRHSLIGEYRRVLGDSNNFLHCVSGTPVDMGKVRDHYEDAADVLAMIFLASERLARIEQLAELPAPQESDLNELRRIMKNAIGFIHFASKMSSPVWFDMMDPDMLKSPSGDPPWLLGSLAEHLKAEHVDAFVRMLEKNFDEWASDDAGLAELGFVAYKLGDDWIPRLVEILERSENVRKDHDKKRNERSKMNQPDPKLDKEIDRIGNLIRNLDNHAQCAFLNIKQPNPEFVKLANHLLNSDYMAGIYTADDIYAKLVEGMNHESAISIIDILVCKLRAGLESRIYQIPRLDSIDEPDYDRSFGINGLVASLCEALVKFRDLGVPTSQIIDLLDKLPERDRSRFEAWLYSIADDVADPVIVRYVADACGGRHSNYEDGLLLDRLKRDDRIGDIGWRVSALLGSAPDAEKIVIRPYPWGIDREGARRLTWARTLKHLVEVPEAWRQCLDVVDNPPEAERNSNSEQAPEASEVQDTTLTDGSGTDDPVVVAAKIAAKDPGVGGFLGLVDGRSPVSDLTNIVRCNATKWTEDPIGVINTLNRPEYVAGYFRGLASSEEALDSHADRIIHAVKFARDIQWDGGASGSTTFYHDGEPTSVDMVGMTLIKKMVKDDIGLGKDSLADVWSVVVDAIICPDPKTDEQPDYSIEYLRTVDSLPHVQAVYTLFGVIRYAKRNDAEVPRMALTRLTEAIRLTGQYGVDYHACIGPEALLMHWLDPDWFEQNEQYLFGRAASAELGRVALDMHLEQVQPANFVLVKYRNMVLDAVKRDVHMALRHLLGCLLYGTRGYDPEYVAKSLMEFGPEYVSKTGWHIFRLLREGADADHIRYGIAFWDSVLKHPPKPKPEALVGFGWWADVPGIDQEQWEEMMLPTCEMANGKLEWAQRVAERISTSQTMTDAGWRILALLISADLPHGKHEVIQHATEALSKTADIGDAPESRSHLYEVMLERGFLTPSSFDRKTP